MARKTRESRKGSKSEISVDLSEVTTSKTIPEGDYHVTLQDATVEKSRNGNDFIKMEFEVSGGKYSGSKLYHNCSLQPQALFNLRNVLEALGMSIPNKAFDLNLKELIGLDCEVIVAHEKYEGKNKAVITDFLLPEDNEEDNGEDDDISSKLEELDISDLKKLAKELDIKVKKGMSEEDIVEEILDLDEEEVVEAYEELFGEEENEEDDEDEEDDGEEDEDEEDEDEEDEDYSDMSLSELKAECKARKIKFNPKAKSKELIKLLEEDDEE